MKELSVLLALCMSGAGCVRQDSSILDDESEMVLSPYAHKAKDVILWALDHNDSHCEMRDGQCTSFSSEAYRDWYDDFLYVTKVDETPLIRFRINGSESTSRIDLGWDYEMTSGLIVMDQDDIYRLTISLAKIESDLRRVRPIELIAPYLHDLEGFMIDDRRVYTYLKHFEYRKGDVTFEEDVATRHRFKHARHQEMIEYLAVAMNLNTHGFVQTVARLDQGRRDFWTNDTDSLTEPNDLLVTRAKNIAIERVRLMSKDRFNLNEILLSKMVQTAINSLFGRELEDRAYRIAIARASDKRKEALVLCVRNWHEDPEAMHLPGLINMEILGVSELAKIADQDRTIRCGNRDFSLSLRVLEMEGVESGIQPFADATEIRAMGQIALTETIERGAVNMAIAYLRARGYELEGLNPVNSLREEFSEEFKRSHIFIPVTHSLDINRQLIGFSEGHVLRVAKTFPRAGSDPVKLNLAFFIPPFREDLEDSASDASRIVLDFEGLSGLMCDRSCRMESSLFVLNQSCQSKTNVDKWMQAHARAQEMRGERGLDPKMPIPVAVGSDRYFSTSSNLSILSHIEYPLAVLEGFGNGDSAEDVIEALRKPVQGSLRRILSGLADQWGRSQMSGGSSRINDDSFKPVCNLNQIRFAESGEISQYVLVDSLQPDERFIY